MYIYTVSHNKYRIL